MMKRIVTIISLALACCCALAAPVSERVFVSLDRPVYAAGDILWCSAFCVDASTGALSRLSSIAYVEIHSAEGLVHTAKIALDNGRGAGQIKLPAGLKTGNYRLFAYTAQNRNEQDCDYTYGARTFSVVSTTSSARVKDGVEIVDDDAYCDGAAEHVYGDVSISVPSSAGRSAVIPVTISNAGPLASVSVSVWHRDAITAPGTTDIGAFVDGLVPGSAFTDTAVPEYEGEIIRARVVGADDEMRRELLGKYGFISAPGDGADTYSSPIFPDGSLSFYTNNIYGSKDLVCEIEGIDNQETCHIELESPFVKADAGEIPVMQLCRKLGPDIKARGIRSRIESMFAADTLYELLPYRRNLLLSGESKTYILDDYTRFPLMDEVFVEIVHEINAYREHGVRYADVRLTGDYFYQRPVGCTSLIMVDGVPVFDHSRIFAYDPLLVESVRIYPYLYSVGSRTYSGAANMVTYKHNLPSMDFSGNVRIVSFEGPALPMAYTCSGLKAEGDYPDYRQTAYWHPLVTLGEKEKTELEVALPSYEGEFEVVVEGLDGNGKPVRAHASFSVR